MKIKIEFNEQQLQVLDSALMEIPYRMAAPLINYINQQIKEQQASEIESEQIKNNI